MSDASFAEFKFMAVHDGPGIRSTLFLKGCPLSCRWCHNPESISTKPQLVYRDSRCANCGTCVSVCPNNAHSIDSAGRHALDRTKCIKCRKCEDTCFHNALQLIGRKVTPEKAATILLEDRDFYEVPGGGVTLSGGEPLFYPNFCAELFEILGKENIHRALDTSGAISWDAFEKVLPVTDLVLYDIKHIDDEPHIRYTGSSNKRILDNLAKLSKTEVPFEVRMLLIPGINMDVETIAQTGKLLPD